MGFEVKYMFHPRKEDGPGYNTDVQKDNMIKVGKPFDDTPLEKCAATIMAQLARRDVWVVDVEVSELVKKKISFKESKDGKGIVLKNKRFSLVGTTAEMIEEQEVTPPVNVSQSNLQPHEMGRSSPPHQNQDNLYSNPNTSVVRRSVDPRNIDRNKTVYQVYFEPEGHFAEAQRLNLRFTKDTRYAVHQVISSPTGKLDNQQVAITDDTGQIVILDEKFFVTAGVGLIGDKQLNFSGNNGKNSRAKLSYEDQMIPNLSEEHKDEQVAIDLSVPDIRAN